MLVSDVMTAPARSLTTGDSLDDAVELLGQTRISAIPVVDEGGRVVGILSEADVLRESLPRDPRVHLRVAFTVAGPSRLVDEIMTRDPHCVAPTADCAEVAALFAEKGFKSLPVVEDDRLVGVVSRSDILRAMSTPSPALTDAVARAFDAAGLPGRAFTVQSGHVTLSPADDGLDQAAMGIVATVPGVRSVRLD